MRTYKYRNIDLIGQVYGHAKVIGMPYIKDRMSKGGKRKSDSYVQCKCECGNVFDTKIVRLIDGTTKSCGCYKSRLQKEKFTIHGQCRSVEYNTWNRIKDRCYNEKCIAYGKYGGSGITVCDRWLNSFEDFLKDMGFRPKGDRYSIERINGKGNYEPNNCKWATPKEQAQNINTNVMVLYNGKMERACILADKFGISSKTVCRRLRLGWDIYSSLDSKTNFRFKKNKKWLT